MFANVLQPLIDVFEQVLLFFHDKVGFSWGWSIIAMTAFIRFLMLPLTIKQFHSMQAMARLKPKIDALRKKYGDDRQRINQEMMKVYQENKVNPFGSCLPLVLQLPVFISLFYMLQKDLRLDICNSTDPCGPGEASFLFISDLTDKATGSTLIILIVLYVGSQLLSSLLMQSATADPMTRKLMLVLPFIFVPFIVRFPAGLMVYWITTNLWTVGQQYVLRRTIKHQVEEGELGDDAGLPDVGGVATAKGGGGLFNRMMERAQAAQAERAERPGGDTKTKAKATGSENGHAPAPKRSTPPPSSPRKKKKRSGRRR
jgi:YidC/Oxa1 family membrane protein insertase